MADDRCLWSFPGLGRHFAEHRMIYCEGRWKPVVSAYTPLAPARPKQPIICGLYDLEDDPAEVTNLVRNRPELANSMQNRLQKIIDRERSTPREP